MNDDFLTRFRKPPPPEFAAALYKRISQPMNTQFRNIALRRVTLITSVLGLGVVVGFLILGAVARAGGFIWVLNPEGEDAREGLVPPFLSPPDSEVYRPVQPFDGAITSPGGHPVAQLNTPPVELAKTISVWFPDYVQQPVDGEVAFTILASIKYTGDNHVVLITTSRPSLAVSSQPVVLGTQEVKLSNGTTAWASVSANSMFPNRVLFVQDDLIISIASDLSMNEVLNLAVEIVVR